MTLPGHTDPSGARPDVELRLPAGVEPRAASLDALVEATVPESIRLERALDLPPAVSESALIARARELAERQLDAEERKFAVGTTTNFEVLTFQRDLANARTSELQAIPNYMNSVARLEQAKGTLLESLGMSIGMAGVSGRPR